MKATRFSSPWLKRRIAIIMIFSGSTVLLFWYYGAFAYARPTTPQSPSPPSFETPDQNLLISLPEYGKFQGTKLMTNLKKTVTFSKAVDAWLNVEYSTQPVGEGRFKPVTWPAGFEGTKDATTMGPACFQDMYSSLGQSEACLTLNIYRPSHVPMDTKLPSFVYLHGGAFVGGSHKSFDGPLFVEKSVEPLMVITVQYRLGALGSLPGKFMEEGDLLNLGIRDQRMALEFLQKYISEFGGDKEQITLGGQSAGGHAVGIHLYHNYGSDAGNSLFSKAIISSGSPTARAFPGVDFPLYQRQVSDFMGYLNCPETPSSAALECLQGVQAHDIQFISSSVFSAHNRNLTWPWQPVSPGPLFETRGSTSGAEGTFFKVPLLISSVTNEGYGFVPQDVQTNEEFVSYWKTLVPGLSAEDLVDLQTLYPEQKPKAGTMSYVSGQYQRLAESYGDYAYICPVQLTAIDFSKTSAPVYKARFDTPNFSPTYQGVPHASDSSYFQGSPKTQFPEISEIYPAYWASFIVTGNPNTHRLDSSSEWGRYEGAGSQELVVNPPIKGGVQMEQEGTAIRLEQCAWWNDPSRAARLNK
ncbi:hypothetical protein HRS9122_09112 [Pyrenophora teres f. teres]|nr:hypothetical protein HRS9122_09112 [Pyrenophora teres f. teres]KAE8857119.1 hypothetical protein PTNB29_08186 [Pyrenophora teres f. teres]